MISIRSRLIVADIRVEVCVPTWVNRGGNLGNSEMRSNRSISGNENNPRNVVSMFALCINRSWSVFGRKRLSGSCHAVKTLKHWLFSNNCSITLGTGFWLWRFLWAIFRSRSSQSILWNISLLISLQMIVLQVRRTEQLHLTFWWTSIRTRDCFCAWTSE